MSNKALVIGGAGFIGSFIAQNFAERGIEPILLDAYVTYITAGQSNPQLYFRYRQEREKILSQFHVIRGNTHDKDYMRRVIMQYRPRYILQLAALPLANISNTFSEETIESIFDSTVNALEIVRDVDFVDRFLYTSSSMVYGDFQYTPADENHPTKPKSVYGGAKLCGEVITRTFEQSYGIEYVIIRPSAVYGPTDVNRRVVQIFVEDALHGKPLVLKGADKTVLDFSYVKDVARGFVLATLSPNARNETFNITAGEGRSLRELANIIRQHIPNVQIKEEEIDKSIPIRGALDISRAQELIQYKPEYNLERGVEEYIQFVRQCMEK